jgi:PAS domain S-box-containing protein
MYCQKSDQVLGQKGSIGIHIHNCLSGGLLDACASITVGNKKIANWFIGQVHNESLNSDKIRSFADEIGVNTEEFIKAYNDVPRMSEEQFQKIVKAHFLIAKQLSDIAFQNIKQARIIAVNRKISGKLKQTMHSYQDVLNSVSEAIFIQEPETGVIIDVNKGAEKIYGYSREEFIGKIPLDLAAPGMNDLENLSINARDVFYSGLSSIAEFWAVRKSGEIFPKEIILNKGRYFGKDVLIATSRDITRQKETDNQIKKDKTELSSIVNAGNIFIIKTDLKGKYTYHNRYFSQKFSWLFGGEEIAGKSSLNSIVPEDYQKTAEIVNQCIQNPNRTFQIELRKPNFNGTAYTTLWEFMCLTDLDGNPSKILCIGFDITAQKKAEISLRKSEEKYRALVDNAFEGIIIIDIDGTVLFANQSLIKTFEYECLDDVTGKSVFEFIAPESIPQAIEDLTKVVQGIELEVAHYSGITSKGNKISFESIGKIIDYEGKQADLISVRDITAKVHAKNALRESEEKYRMIAENMSDIV